MSNPLEDKLFSGLDLNFSLVTDSALLDSLQSTIEASQTGSNSGSKNFIQGSEAANKLDGRGKDDVIIGATGDDEISGQGGRDVLQGSAGSDQLLGQGGDDFFIYRLSDNLNNDIDHYDGGGDTQGPEDSIWFMLTHGEYKAHGSEIEAYQSDLNNNKKAHGFSYEFTGFGLTVDDIESAEIILSNRGPSAFDDAFTTDEDTLYITTDVRGNDTDPDNLDELSVDNLNTTGTIGTVTPDFGAGTFSYNPNSQFEYLAVNESTTDSFSYTISDLAGVESTATVTMTINGVNDAPVADDDSADTLEDTPVTLAVLTNDSDVDVTDILNVSGVTNGANGAVVISPDNKKVSYTPNTNWSGTDSFTYTVADGNGGFDTATATVNVEAVADAPELSLDVSAGATVNEVVIDISSSLVDTDGSESYGLSFSDLPAGVTLQGALGGEIITPNGSDQVTLVLAEGVDFDFNFAVTATSTEASNSDTAITTESIDIILDSNNVSRNITFEAVDQSIWTTGSEFVFNDSRFLGIDKSGSGRDPSGLIRSNYSYDVKAGFQSDLAFEGGDIDAQIPWQLNFQTDFNRTTDVLTIDTLATLLPGGFFNTDGPSLDYELDFIFNYDVDVDVRVVKDFGSIDFEVVEFDLGSMSKTIFNFDKARNYSTNLIDFDSDTAPDFSIDFPYGITGTVAWPNLEISGSEDTLGSYSGNGASNNALNVSVDLDTALADIFLGGANPFDIRANFGIAGGRLELLDADVAAGFNFIQEFLLDAGTLDATLIFEDGTASAFTFGDELIFTSASSLDSDDDGIVEFDIAMILSGSTLSNDTDLGFNVGWNFDLVKGSWWYDVDFGSGSFLGIDYDLGGISGSGGFGPYVDLGQNEIPVANIDVFTDIVGVNFAVETIGLIV